MPRIPAILDLTHTSSVSAPSSNPCYFALRDSSLGTFSSRSVLHESRLAQAASCYTTAGSLLSGHFALRDSWLSCSSNVGTSHFVLHDSWLPATSCYTTAGSVFGHFVLHDSWPRPFRATRHLAHFQATSRYATDGKPIFRPLRATRQQAQATSHYATVGSVALATLSLATSCYTTAGSFSHSLHMLQSLVAITRAHTSCQSCMQPRIKHNILTTTATLASLTLLRLLWGKPEGIVYFL